jgi:AcrR family transcriptional regulator
MQRVTRRDQQAEERRQQLLDTALVLFAQRGFENTSIKDLSEAAGVAQGLVYHYFPSKEAVLFAILEQRNFRPELRRLLEVAPERPAMEVLQEVASRLLALLAEREYFMRIVLREMQINPQVADLLQQRIQDGVELLAAYLDTRIQAGELRPHDPRVTARALFYTVVMLHLTHTADTGFLPAFVSTLLHGIKAR